MNNPIAEFSIKCAIAACAIIACLVVAKVLFAPRFEPFGGPCSANVPWAYDTKTGKVVAPAYGKLTEWPADSK